jgi:hypothetical protein
MVCSLHSIGTTIPVCVREPVQAPANSVILVGLIEVHEDPLSPLFPSTRPSWTCFGILRSAPRAAAINARAARSRNSRVGLMPALKTRA